MNRNSVVVKPKWYETRQPPRARTIWAVKYLPPVRDGVYEIKLSGVLKLRYALYEEGIWFMSSEYISNATHQCVPALDQYPVWRGLAVRPVKYLP